MCDLFMCSWWWSVCSECVCVCAWAQDRAWANVAMSLNCIIAMSDRLLGREACPPPMTSSERHDITGDTNSENTGETSGAFRARRDLLCGISLKPCVSFSSSLLLLLCLLLAGAAAASGGHAQGLRARGRGEGPSCHDIRGPASCSSRNSLSGSHAAHPETPRRLQPGGETA